MVLKSNWVTDDVFEADDANDISTQVNANTAKLESGSTTGLPFVVDEDDMSSNSAFKVPTQQSVKAYVDASYLLKANLASPTFTGTVGGITKSMVGLGSVDNTADTDKPVSTAQQTALDLKLNAADASVTNTRTPTDGTVTTAKFAASALVTAAEGLAGNDNDTTIPTSAAVLDAIAGGAIPLTEDRFIFDGTGLTATHPTTSLSGHTLSWAGAGTTVDFGGGLHGFYVTPTPGGAFYMQSALSSNIQALSCGFSFVTYGTDTNGAAITLAATNMPIDPGDPDFRMSAHVFTTRTAMTVTLWDASGPGQIILAVFTYDNPLQIGKKYEFGWIIEDDTLVLQLPDGQVRSVTDSRIGDWLAPNFFAESFTAASTDSIAVVHDVWASTVPERLAIVGNSGGSGGGTPDDGSVTTAKFAGSALVTAAEGLNSSDNDTSVPTTAAVIDAIAAVGGGSGSTGYILNPTADKTTNYTASSNDYVIVNATGTVVVTAPPSPSDGDPLAIYIRAGTSDVSFTANSGQELLRDGSATTTFPLQASGVATVGLSLWQYEATGAYWYLVHYSAMPASTDIVDSGTTGRLLIQSETTSDLQAIIDLEVGVDVQAFDADLAAFAALSPSNDDIVQRKSGAWTNRTMAQLKTDLALNNVTNNAQYYAGGTDVPVTDGGTGVSTLTGIVKGNGTSAFSAATAGTDYYNPGGTDVSVADGGTGRSTSTTAYGLIAAGTTATGAHQTISPGTSGHFLKSGGGSALGAFAAITQGDVASLTSDLAAKAPLASPTFTGTVSGVTKAHVGLGNVDNTADTAKPVSTAQQTALDLKANLASPTFTGTVSGVTATHVGLGNVDNTSDATKWAASKTLTNTTIDANGTGNAISNLEVADFAGSAIVTAAEGLASSDNDTSIPTTAAVIDAIAAGGGGGGTPDDGTVTTAKIAAATLVTAADTISANDNDTTIPTSAAVLDAIASGAIPGLTASAAELNILDGATLSTAELNYVDGVTSAIQTQLNAKYGSGGTDVPVTDGGTGVSTLTGIVKGNGTSAFSAASAGTDYYAPGSTDVAVADGGTGRSTSTTAYGLIAAGTTATGAHQTLAAGATTEVLVGGGASALPVWTTATGSGAPVRATSPTLVTPALGTPSSGTLTSCTGLPVAGIAASTSTALGVGSVELGHATDTTLSRSAAGKLAVEGVDVVLLSGAQTLTDKTLTSPVINTPTGIVKGDVGLSNVDNTADSAKAVASAAVLTTARNINGVSFNGSANITVADATKAAISGSATGLWMGTTLPGSGAAGVLYVVTP